MYFFRDRSHAGMELAKALQDFAGDADTILLALPRGGIPVASEMSRELGLPMEVFIVRKLGVPGQEELAMGAIAENNNIQINEDIVRQLNISPAQVERTIEREKEELKRRCRIYRGNRPLPDLRGRTVIIVDDGLATGATMLVAVKALRQERAGQIIIAVPVGAASTCRELSRTADNLICLLQSDYLDGVGQWYKDFSQLSDENVLELLTDRDSDSHVSAARCRKPEMSGIPENRRVS